MPELPDIVVYPEALTPRILGLKLERAPLKRALTDPRLFDGIGNAYSDEILHAARLSPRTTGPDRSRNGKQGSANGAMLTP